MSDDVKAAAEDVMARAATILEDHATPILIGAVTLAKAYLAEHPADDAELVDFAWLIAQAEEHHSDSGYGDGVWWEIGPLSFTCGDYQSDPGEPRETVATDWQVEGEKLPKALVPRTRGNVRQLCRMLGVTLKDRDVGK